MKINQKYKATDISLRISVENIARWGVKDSSGRYVSMEYGTYDQARVVKEQNLPATIVPVMGLEQGLDAAEFHLIAREVKREVINLLGKNAQTLYSNYNSGAITVEELEVPFAPMPLDQNRNVIVKITSATITIVNP